MTNEAGKTTTDEAISGRINPIHELVGALFGPKAVDQIKEADADMSADALEAGADSEKASG